MKCGHSMVSMTLCTVDITMTDEITWRTDNLPKSRIEKILGASFVAQIEQMGDLKGAIFCCCRAHGWRDANEREYHAAYRSLCRILCPQDRADLLVF